MTTSERPTTDALAEFTTYFVKNYPGPDTIIHDPYWHAPRIFRAAQLAMLASAPASPAIGVQAVKALEPVEAMREAYLLGRRQWCPAGILKDEERTERDWLKAKGELEAALHPAPEAASPAFKNADPSMCVHHFLSATPRRCSRCGWDFAANGDPPEPEAASAGGAGKVKPLDLSHLIRDAFLSGRGLKDGDKLSEADQAAFMEYDPTEHVSYKRIYAALYPSLTPSDTAPSPKVREQAVSEAMRKAAQLSRLAMKDARRWFHDAKVGYRLDEAIAALEAALSQEHAPGRKESQP